MFTWRDVDFNLYQYVVLKIPSVSPRFAQTVVAKKKMPTLHIYYLLFDFSPVDIARGERAHYGFPHYLNHEVIFAHYILHNSYQIGLSLAHVPLLMFNFSL